MIIVYVESNETITTIGEYWLECPFVMSLGAKFHERSCGKFGKFDKSENTKDMFYLSNDNEKKKATKESKSFILTPAGYKPTLPRLARRAGQETHLIFSPLCLPPQLRVSLFRIPEPRVSSKRKREVRCPWPLELLFAKLPLSPSPPSL